jgi:hypothetical protein
MRDLDSVWRRRAATYSIAGMALEDWLLIVRVSKSPVALPATAQVAPAMAEAARRPISGHTQTERLGAARAIPSKVL